MEKEKGIKTLAIAAIVLAVVSLSVAYAAFSTTLNINGNATVKGNQWSVHYVVDSKTATPTGQATNVSDNFSLTTTDYSFTANLVKPGDSVTYTAQIINDGQIDAKLTSITGPTVEGEAAEYLDVTFSGLTAGETLAANGGTATVTITVTYKSTVEQGPTKDVTATISGAFLYDQA